MTEIASSYCAFRHRDVKKTPDLSDLPQLIDVICKFMSCLMVIDFTVKDLMSSGLCLLSNIIKFNLRFSSQTINQSAQKHGKLMLKMSHHLHLDTDGVHIEIALCEWIY